MFATSRLTLTRTSRLFARGKAASASRLDLGAAPAFFMDEAPAEGGGPAASAAAYTLSATGQALAPASTPIAVRSRYGLPGAARPGTNALLPETLPPPRADFPAVLQAETGEAGEGGELVAQSSPWRWAQALRPHLDEMLPKHGIVCVTGLGECIGHAEGFTRFVEAVKSEYTCTRFMEGRSMTSTQVTDLVRTGSDDHPAYTIEPHNEYNVAAKHRPRKLFLVCSEEPTDGGEWCVTHGPGVLADMPRRIVEQFEAKGGVRYEVWYPSAAQEGVYNHWQENIAPTRAEAEEYLARSGCQWEWHEEDESLTIVRTDPAIAPHPETGEDCWFNQVHAHHRTFYQDCHPDFEGRGEDSGPWPVHTKYGDGSEIADDDIALIREAVWKNTVGVPLKKGLLMVVDNYRALHGRMSYAAGTPRQSLVSIIYE
jgi:hypothetical protein